MSTKQRLRPNGTVLIVVLVIVILISLAAYNFTLTMESEHIATRNVGDRLAARQSALSGAEVLAAFLEQPRANRSRAPGLAGEGLELWPAESTDSASYHVTGRFSQQASADPQAMELLTNESAKLHLHALMSWEREFPGHAREALLRLPGMDEPTLQHLLGPGDIDPGRQNDLTHTPHAVPLLIDEIPLPSSEGDELADPVRPAWLDYITTVSAQRNESFDGKPRINLNVPDLGTLHQQLAEVVPLPVANYIVLMRQYGIGRTSRRSVDAASATIDLMTPATFELTSLMQLIESAVRVRATEKVQVVASPIDATTGAVGMPIDEIFDRLTLSSEPRLAGRIDILTAPVEVIAAIPGLDSATAQQIAAARSGADRETRHPIGILSLSGLDATIVERVLKYFTVGGDVVRAEMIGSSAEGLPEFRCEVIVDASQGRATWMMLNL